MLDNPTSEKMMKREKGNKAVRIFILFNLFFLLSCSQACVPPNAMTESGLLNERTEDPQPFPTQDSQLVINPVAQQLVEKEAGYCKALAPADWSFNSVPPYVGADLFSPDQRSHAAWGIASIFKALYPSSQSALVYLLELMGYQNPVLSSQLIDIGYGFSMAGFTSAIGRQGQVFYKIYDFDADFFIISLYLASTENGLWQSHGSQALSAALSIRCLSQLRPTTTQLILEDGDPSNEQDNPEVDLSEKWSEAILGFENVYSPTTGEHYLAPLESYWETGPNGAGYYRELPGGGLEILEYGFGTY